MSNNREIWKVRAVKPYPEAHNHLLVGRVIETNESYIKMLCKSYHFGRVVNNAKDMFVGRIEVRIIPWARVEIVNELNESFDFQKAGLTSGPDGDLVISDGHTSCLLMTARDRRS